MSTTAPSRPTTPVNYLAEIGFASSVPRFELVFETKLPVAAVRQGATLCLAYEEKADSDELIEINVTITTEPRLVQDPNWDEADGPDRAFDAKTDDGRTVHVVLETLGPNPDEITDGLLQFAPEPAPTR